MDWKDLRKIIKTGENARVEFKQSDKLKDSEEIAKQLISFANRDGGMVIFGVTDDSKIEGAKINRDQEILKITQVAEDSCSPKIDFSPIFFHSRKGDILIVNVKRREGMPHAYVKKSNDKIRSREYYIRLNTGKRFITDNELEWLFKNSGNVNINYDFRVAITYIRKQLGIPAFSDFPHYLYHFVGFLDLLSEENRKFLMEDEPNRMRAFFIELAPYAMLETFQEYFSTSWLTEINRRKGESKHRPIKGLDSKEIHISDLKLSSDSIISSFSLDINKANAGFDRITLPSKTDVSVGIETEKGLKTSFLKIFKDDVFDFKIKFRPSSWGVGLPFAHPLRYKYCGVGIPIDAAMEFQKQIASFQIEANFEAKFGFPDVENPLFEKYQSYARLIQDIIKWEWDWDIFLNDLPEGQIYLLERKIDDILKILL